jgi:hypothetical protein
MTIRQLPLQVNVFVKNTLNSIPRLRESVCPMDRYWPWESLLELNFLDSCFSDDMTKIRLQPRKAPLKHKWQVGKAGFASKCLFDYRTRDLMLRKGNSSRQGFLAIESATTVLCEVHLLDLMIHV